MVDVFISYRRDDSAGTTGRVYDALVRRLGARHVFRDIEVLEPGAPFAEEIDRRLRRTDYLLAVIGQDWLTITDDHGHRRLDKPDDIVRLEIATALARDDVVVVPLLVDGATLPVKDALPADVRPLTERNYHELRNAQFSGDLRLLVEKLGLPRQRLRRQVTASLGAFVTAAVVAAVTLAPREGDDVMTGQFNIAVAEVDVQSPDGTEVNSPDGEQLGRYIADRLTSNLDALDVDAQVWPPERTGRISGEAPSERRDAAAARAGDIGADILVHGVVITDGASYTADGPPASTARYQPEFYIELSGADAQPSLDLDDTFGPPTAIPSPFKAGDLAFAGTPGFVARLSALGKIVAGLSYSAADNHRAAKAAFEAAFDTEGWAEQDGHAVVHLLVGNEALQLSYLESSDALLDEARTSFSRALRLEPDAIRPRIGLAVVDYVAASGDQAPPYDDLDLAGLDKASTDLRAIIDSLTTDMPPEVASVAQFNLGQTYLINSLASGTATGDLWARAERSYQTVIDLYTDNGRPASLAPFAARAHARLGFIVLASNPSAPDLGLAMDQYAAAAAIAPPALGASYQADLAAIQVLIDPCLAADTYAKAALTADLYGRSDDRTAYDDSATKARSHCHN
jgi:tetratricopeptide (TPR) repeat protein